MRKITSYPTDFKYLKIPVKQPYPKFLHKYVLGFFKHGGVTVVKIIAPILGFGIPTDGVKRYPEVMIKLKDGTRLATDVYLPRKIMKKKGKVPTIIIRLPYWKDSMLCILGYAFASYGYAVVMQDTRGCAHSDGFNFFLQTERDDGLELLDWITKQYWYNGKMGMCGGSYFGLTQLALSWDNDKLSCIAPAICSVSNLWKHHGGLKIHGLTTAIYRIMLNIVINRESPLIDVLTPEIRELFLNPKFALYNETIVKKGDYLKFSDFIGKPVEECVEMLADFYKVPKWSLTKRNYKVFFKFLEDFLKLEKDIDNMPGLLEYDPKKFSQPAFILAGWQDMFLEHQLIDFKKFQENAQGDVLKYTKLVIGPWGHADPGHKEGSLIGFLKEFLNKGWYDYWLKDKKDAFEDIDSLPIKYYVIGRKYWRYSDVWPPKNIEYKKLYLHSGGWANTVNGNGILSFEAPADESEDSFKFNPLKPVITRGGRNLALLKGSQDQKDAEARNDVLVYSIGPLEKGVELTGPIKLVLYASSSATDTDFIAKIVDVTPKGKALHVLDGGIRARYRNGEDNPSLIVPGKIIEYEIKIGNTSNYFGPGHQIRLEVSSSLFPRYDLNSNLGDVIKPGECIIADQKVFHDKKNPSHLIIPVYK